MKKILSIIAAILVIMIASCNRINKTNLIESATLASDSIIVASDSIIVASDSIIVASDSIIVASDSIKIK